MSFSCKKSYNNSDWSKERRKLDAMDLDDVNGNIDRGGAIFNVESRSGCIRTLHKDKHIAPSEDKKMPDKAIMKIDESKLVVRKDDDIGFAVKPAAGSKAGPKASSAPKKQNLVAELGLFASATVSLSAPVPEAPLVAPKPSEPTMSWRNRSAK
jgi:hypothetical protein